MLNFFISVVVFAVATFLLAVSIRYGMLAIGNFDNWLNTKSHREYDGFNWHFRIPFYIGMIPEYFYAMVLGKDNYYKTNWWALKISSFVSMLLFVALLKSRHDVAEYYSLALVTEKGLSAYFTSGTHVWYLNCITLLYASLAVLISIESVKVAHFYAPVRVLFYGILCFLMAGLTLAILGLIVFVSLVYIGFKVIKFLFFNRKRKRIVNEDEETAGDILKGGFSTFKNDLLEWEAERRSNRKTRNSIKKRKSPVIKRKVTIKEKAPVKPGKPEMYDDIPRLRPD